jgi:phage terminase large subunit-like protein
MMGAYECWLAITGKHPYRKFPANGKMWICATSFEKTQNINLPKFELFMPSSYKPQSRYNKQEKIWWIVGEDREWKVQFKSADARRRAFEGDDIDCMWFDEEMPEDIYSECMMRLIDRRGIWWMTATPMLGTAWLKRKTEDPKVFDTYGASWDNPYLPIEEIEAASANLTEEERLVRVEGKYIIFGGKPVFDVLSMTNYLSELKDKHPLGIRGSLCEAA